MGIAEQSHYKEPDLDQNTLADKPTVQRKTTRKNTAALAADVTVFSSVFVSLKKRKTDTRNMLCYAILFCTFPEIQGVGYRKNPVQEGRSAFSVRGLEKTLGGMEGKRQGLSYFLSFFFSLHHSRKGLGRLSSLECCSGHCWEGSNDKRTQDAIVYCDRTGQLLMHLVPRGHRVIQKASVCCVSDCWCVCVVSLL